MQNPVSKLILALSVVLSALSAIVAAREAQAADDYPTRTIQMIVPFPAGGAYDGAARIIAPRLSQELGVPVVVVPKPGASGMLGAGAVLSAPPDGYTILSTGTPVLTLVRLYKKEMTYSYRDFAAIGNYATDVNAILVRADAKWKSLRDLLDDAKAAPGKLNYGSPGVGSVSSTVMEVIKKSSGTDIVSVPFVGSPAVNVALLGKQIDVGSVSLTSAVGLLQDGQLRVLGVSGSQSLPSLPDAKTFRDQGLKDADMSLKIGLFASARTPAPVLGKLAAAFNVAAKDPEVAAALAKMGLLVQTEEAAAARKSLEEEDRYVTAIGDILKITPN